MAGFKQQGGKRSLDDGRSDLGSRFSCAVMALGIGAVALMASGGVVDFDPAAVGDFTLNHPDQFHYAGEPATSSRAITHVVTNELDLAVSAKTNVFLYKIESDLNLSGTIDGTVAGFAKTGAGTLTFSGNGTIGWHGNDWTGLNGASQLTWAADGTSIWYPASSFALYEGSFVYAGGNKTLTLRQNGTRITVGGWSAVDGEQEPDVTFRLESGTVAASCTTYVGHHHGYTANTPKGPAKAIFQIDGGRYTQGGGKHFFLGNSDGAGTGRAYNGEVYFIQHGGQFSLDNTGRMFYVYCRPGQKPYFIQDGGSFWLCYFSIGGNVADAEPFKMTLADSAVFSVETFRNNVENKSNGAATTLSITNGATFRCDWMCTGEKGTLDIFVDGGILTPWNRNYQVKDTRKIVVTNGVTSLMLGTKGATLVARGSSTAVFGKGFAAAADTDDGGLTFRAEDAATTGVIELGGHNAYTGPTVFESGTVTFGEDGDIPSASTVTFLNGGVRLSAPLALGATTFGAEGETTKPFFTLGPGAYVSATAIAVKGTSTLNFTLLDDEGSPITTPVSHRAVLRVPAGEEEDATLENLRVVCANEGLAITSMAFETDAGGETSTLYVTLADAGTFAFAEAFTETALTLSGKYVLSGVTYKPGVYTVATYAGDSRLSLFSLKGTPDLVPSFSENTTDGVTTLTLTLTPKTAVDATWIATTAGGDWSIAANWQAATKPVNDRSAWIAFAAAGASEVPITWTGDVKAGALDFAATTEGLGYHLGGMGTLTLGAPTSGGVKVGEGTVVTVGNGTTATGSLSVEVATNATLAFTKCLAGGADLVRKGSGTLALTNATLTTLDCADAGTTLLDGTTLLTGAASVTNGILRVRGKVESGTGNGTFTIRGSKQITDSRVIWDGVDFDKPIDAKAGVMGAGNWFTTAAGTTNVFRKRVALHDPWTYLTIAADSQMVVEDVLTSSWTVRQQGSGELVVRGPNGLMQFFSGSGYQVMTDAKLIFEDGATSIFGGKGLRVESGTNDRRAALECRSSGALTDGLLELVAGYSRARVDVELHATTQTVDIIRTAGNYPGNVTVHGDYPSLICVAQGAEGALQNTNISCQVTGGVGFWMKGEGTLLLTNRVFTSCGDLTVEKGVMELGANASWLNGTNFVVAGTGTLRLTARNQISPVASMAFADDGLISIPSDVTVKVAVATRDGNSVPSGIYRTGDTAGILAGCVTGGGRLMVGAVGTMIIFR